MNRVHRWWVAGLTCLVLAGVPAAHAKEGKKERGVLRAERAGWMLGMYVGEQKGSPYPFVLQLDEASDARNKGVKVGDEIIRFDDQEIYSLKLLFDRATSLRAGRYVKFWVRRGVETHQFELRVPRNPGAVPEEGKEKASNKGDKGDKTEGDQAENGEKPKKKKKKNPIVIKPIPTDNP